MVQNCWRNVWLGRREIVQGCQQGSELYLQWRGGEGDVKTNLYRVEEEKCGILQLESMIEL